MLTQMERFHPENIHHRIVLCLDGGEFLVRDYHNRSSANADRIYLIPSTMLPPEVAALAAMRMGMQHAATDWPLVPMEDFQLA